MFPLGLFDNNRVLVGMADLFGALLFSSGLNLHNTSVGVCEFFLISFLI